MVDERYECSRWPGVAVYIHQRFNDGQVGVVMVGDDTVRVVELIELREIGDDDYCSGCGQVGCTAEGVE